MIYKEKEIQEFQEWFCNYFHITMKVLRGKTKIEIIVNYRISFAAILLENRVSTIRIGELIDRNHSTISYYLHHRIFNEFDEKLQKIIAETQKKYYNGTTKARKNHWS